MASRLDAGSILPQVNSISFLSMPADMLRNQFIPSQNWFAAEAWIAPVMLQLTCRRLRVIFSDPKITNAAKVICRTAARHGHLGVLEWIARTAQNTKMLDEDVTASAARGGQLEVLQWLRARQTPWDKNVCEEAVVNRHSRLFEWAVSNHAPFDRIRCWEIAVFRGDVLMIESLKKFHANPEQMLKWFRQTCLSGSSHGVQLCGVAAEVGQLRILQLLRQMGASWDITVCVKATQSGHLELLQWALANGAPVPAERLYSYAAIFGRLEILKYLASSGAEGNQEVCGLAAMHGHLDVLKWARDNDFPWDPDECCKEAARGRFFSCCKVDQRA